MSAPRSSTLPAANLEPARWLRTGAIAYTRMLELINNAKVSIRCETYIWGNDAVGARFLSAFAQAASRGVSVKVLIDGAGSSGLPDDYWHALSRAGGEARVFNPITLRNFSLRNHRKLLLIDDHVAVTGGFNLAAEYDGDGVSGGWRDLGLELHDPRALRQLADSFDLSWFLFMVYLTDRGLKTANDLSSGKSELQRTSGALKDAPKPYHCVKTSSDI